MITGRQITARKGDDMFVVQLLLLLPPSQHESSLLPTLVLIWHHLVLPLSSLPRTDFPVHEAGAKLVQSWCKAVTAAVLFQCQLCKRTCHLSIGPLVHLQSSCTQETGGRRDLWANSQCCQRPRFHIDICEAVLKLCKGSWG